MGGKKRRKRQFGWLKRNLEWVSLAFSTIAVVISALTYFNDSAEPKLVVTGRAMEVVNVDSLKTSADLDSHWIDIDVKNSGRRVATEIAFSVWPINESEGEPHIIVKPEKRIASRNREGSTLHFTLETLGVGEAVRISVVSKSEVFSNIAQSLSTKRPVAFSGFTIHASSAEGEFENIFAPVSEREYRILNAEMQESRAVSVYDMRAK